MKYRKPDDDMPHDQAGEMSEGSEAIEACADDLIRAVHAHDAKAAANAIKAAFQILESAEEAPEDIENDYQRQNEIAGQEDR